MRTSRIARNSIAALGAAAMLFVQVAMAAQACMLPGDAPASMAASPADHEAMPCAEMDAGQANPCVDRCNSLLQSVDHHQPVALVPVWFEMYPIRHFNRDITIRSAPSHTDALLTRATAPPLSVRNCCFRI